MTKNNNNNWILGVLALLGFAGAIALSKPSQPDFNQPRQYSGYGNQFQPQRQPQANTGMVKPGCGCSGKKPV